MSFSVAHDLYPLYHFELSESEIERENMPDFSGVVQMLSKRFQNVR
jgi:hypothetical protein